MRQPVAWATTNQTVADVAPLEPIGLAKDGHIIIGPYNEDGELWSCDEHDICNGLFLDDNSYAYAMTWTFPYVVGCWGPGPEQEFEASCTTRSCSGAVSSLATSFTALGVVAALLIT